MMNKGYASSPDCQSLSPVMRPYFSLSSLISAGELVQGSDWECREHIFLCSTTFHFSPRAESGELVTFRQQMVALLMVGCGEALTWALEDSWCRIAGESPHTHACSKQKLELRGGEFEEGMLRTGGSLCDKGRQFLKWQISGNGKAVPTMQVM